MNPHTLVTPAWRLQGAFKATPGVLALEDGRIRFTTVKGDLLNEDAAAVTATFPWYYFGGGAKLTAGGATHRISFVKPDTAADVPDALLPAQRGRRLEGAVDAVSALTLEFEAASLWRGRRAGRAWKRAFRPGAR